MTGRVRAGALAAALAALALPAAAQEGAGLPPSVVTEAPALAPAPPVDAEAPSGGAVPSAAPEGALLAAGATPEGPAQPAPAPAPVPAPGAAVARLAEIVRAAHPVVQAVMGVLALAGFLALTILVQKSAEFALAFARLRRATRALGAAPGLGEAAQVLSGDRGPAAAMARAAAEELRLTEADPALLPGTRERSAAALGRIEAGAALALRSGTGILASIGAIAPFVGLFGTVFGIMNSFLAIAETRTTNLAVVAPGIAEALLATAIGLAAAIPAVLIYNLLSRRLATFRHRLADLSTLVLVLQSRALDRLAARPAARVTPLAPARAMGG